MFCSLILHKQTRQLIRECKHLIVDFQKNNKKKKNPTINQFDKQNLHTDAKKMPLLFKSSSTTRFLFLHTNKIKNKRNLSTRNPHIKLQTLQKSKPCIPTPKLYIKQACVKE